MGTVPVVTYNMPRYLDVVEGPVWQHSFVLGRSVFSCRLS